jgi:hypothetical protein
MRLATSTVSHPDPAPISATDMRSRRFRSLASSSISWRCAAADPLAADDDGGDDEHARPAQRAQKAGSATGHRSPHFTNTAS